MNSPDRSWDSRCDSGRQSDHGQRHQRRSCLPRAMRVRLALRHQSVRLTTSESRCSGISCQALVSERTRRPQTYLQQSSIIGHASGLSQNHDPDSESRLAPTTLICQFRNRRMQVPQRAWAAPTRPYPLGEGRKVSALPSQRPCCSIHDRLSAPCHQSLAYSMVLVQAHEHGGIRWSTASCDHDFTSKRVSLS
jgi:hypothetical protein